MITRYKYSKALNQIIFAALSANQQIESTRGYIKSIFNPKESKYKKVASIINLINKITPGLNNKIGNYILDSNQFPWKPVDMKVIGYGAGSVVIKLDCKNARAIRIYRRSFGKKGNDLLKVLSFYKQSYQTLLHWYGNDIILPMDFLLVCGPLSNSPIAISIQPFIGENFEDIFTCDLESILQGNNNHTNIFRCQIKFFVQKTKQLYNRHWVYPDLIGKENLVVIRKKNQYRLKLLDVGILESGAIQKNNRSKILSKKLEFLNQY